MTTVLASLALLAAIELAIAAICLAGYRHTLADHHRRDQEQAES